MAGLLALAAAACSALGYAVTKQLVDRLPPRELIGPLFALNAALLLPFAPFSSWHWSSQIVLLLLVSVADMVVVSFCVFHLLAHGSAASVSTTQALAPLSATLFSAALLPGRVSAVEVAAATAVTVAVVVCLAETFEALTRWNAGAAIVLAATGNGLLTVLTKLLTDRSAGLVEIYTIRTALAACIWLAIAPPRNIPLRMLPQLTVRAAFVTAQFALLIAAIERGNPVSVQTLFATAPLMLVGGEFIVHRRQPPLRVTLSALVVVGSIVLVTGAAQ